VTRSFGAVKALDEVTFEVLPGRLTGFVGANGAGKTTAMRVIMGVLTPDSGQVIFDGKQVTRETDARFGYMPEERGLYPKMPVRDHLVFLARLHGLDKTRAQANADSLLERLGLAERAKDAVEKLSLGNQQRAQIAAALVHDPAALILDEPFSGLDPMAVDTVMTALRDFAAKGAPILFSSHQLDVVERITDDLVVIANGQVKASGSTTALRDLHAGSRYRITLSPEAPVDWLVGITGVSAVEISQGAGRPSAEPALAGTAAPDWAAGGRPETGDQTETASRVGAGTGGAASGSTEVSFDATAATAQTVLRQALSLGPVDGFERVIPSLSEVFREVIA
jgi:ABC-2 type transport system ATP-binding protein